MRDPRVEEWLQSHGVEYEYQGEVPIGDLDLEQEHSQARFKTDEDHVLAIATGMEAGRSTPPMVVYKEGRKTRLVDGYHRAHAANLLGLKSLDAYMLKGPSKTQVEVLFAEANATHGLPPSMAEREFEALRLVDVLKVDLKQASSMTGVPARRVAAIVADERIRRRLQALGVRGEDVSQARYGRVRLDAIQNDVVLKAAAEVIGLTGMATPAINEMVTAINREHTEAKQLDVVSQFKQRYRVAIKDTAGQTAPLRFISRLSALLTRLQGISPKVLEVDRLSSEHRSKLKRQFARARKHLDTLEKAL